MRFYSEAEMERTMKVQEVILRALAKRISWWQAAEILGISARQMRRWKQRYEKYGYDGLYDRRRQQRPDAGRELPVRKKGDPSIHRAISWCTELQTVSTVLIRERRLQCPCIPTRVVGFT